jgi:signal transduction histidine kinase
VLVSLQNIKSELEEKEMEAWQTLIRILTHEIMNSITPISSLASTTNSILSEELDDGAFTLTKEARDDVISAVRTIEKRSHGLMNFVENYRKLTRIPKPDLKVIPVADLFERIASLMKDQIEQSSIDCRISIVPPALKLKADPVLIEQVLINLCKNAVEAVSERSDAVIEMAARSDNHGKTVIQIADNGQGIEAEVLDKIFIPFFTTKPEGSGIGLSLSKQIMRLHGGTLKASSESGVRTQFTLRF